jgi:Tol biopolymer transport system component/DNA-binding winged helix-turn-helix (wHTH) protein
MLSGQENSEIYQFGAFSLDPKRRLLLKDGAPMQLTPKLFDTLRVLVQQGSRVVSKDDLMSEIWGDSIVEETNLTTNISLLRKLLGETKEEHQYIVTVPGEGYRFVAQVRRLDSGGPPLVIYERTSAAITLEEEAEEVERSEEPERRPEELSGSLTGTIRRHIRMVALGLIAAGLLAIIVTFSAYKFLPSHKSSAALRVGKVTRLTTTGKVGNVAAISPDGKLFAYSLLEKEQQSLWLGHVNGGEPVRINGPVDAIYSSLTFAPDGGSLYYAVGENYGLSERPSGFGLYRLPVFGGAAERIKDNVRSHIAFTPAGRQFAYVRNQGGKTALMLFDIQNQSEQEIIGAPDNLRFVAQSPSWSPDGTTLAVSASIGDSNLAFGVFTVNINERKLKPLSRHEWTGVESIEWERDGSFLVVAARDQNSSLQQLWSVSYPEGEARRLQADLAIYGSAISSSADTQSLLAIQVQSQSNIWVGPAGDLTKAKQVTFSSLGPQDGYWGVDWTPDGRLLYTARAEEGWRVWIANADGSEQRQLTPAGGNNLFPAITGDGRYLIFQSERHGTYAIWREELANGDLKRLTNAAIAAQPDLSSDGKWIVYISAPGFANIEGLGTLYRISVEGGEAERLSDKRANWPRVSPDSKFIACGYEDDDKMKLAILPITGGTPVKLFALPRLANLRFSVRWTPDGKGVTYRDWASGIWRQNLSGGQPERLSELPEEKLYGYGWSRDGKFFAFTRAATSRDVTLLTISR